jgi:fatty acid amide hydrolase
MMFCEFKNCYCIIDALQFDRYTASTVLKAYSWKALQVQDEINCLAEFLIEAFEKADELDKKYSGKADKPSLFGIPFSVKGNFFIKDYDCSIGLAKFLNDPKKHDCTLVDLLHEFGAIPFVLTNVPQALLSFVCSNSVYGTTGNPLNKDRVPGGSSGGEAALLAAHGTPFGYLFGNKKSMEIGCGELGHKVHI